MAVGVVLVGGIVGDADGEEGERRAGQVEAGVSRIRENAERAGEQARSQFEQVMAAAASMECSATRRFSAEYAALPAMGGPEMGGLERPVVIAFLGYSGACRRVQPGDAEGVGLPGAGIRNRWRA